MALFAPIPLPPADNPQFKDVMDYFANLKEMKIKKPLVEAQTEEAKANALKSKMFANLINAAFGGASPEEISGMDGFQENRSSIQPRGYQLTEKEQSQQSQMKPGDSMVVGENQPISNVNYNTSGPSDSQTKARQMLYALGMLKETPQEQEGRENRTAFQREIGSTDAKTLEKWNDSITSSQSIMPVLQNISEISANPAFQEMYKNPQYLGYDLKLLKRFGTPEQQQLLATLGTNAKSIFQSMGQEFKGAFREFELNLFNKATPDELNDTLPQIIAKTNTLMGLRNLAIQRLTLADNIVRSSGGKISPSSALEIADKQVNGKVIRKQIEDQFKASELEQKQAREKANLQGNNFNNKSTHAPKGTTSMFKNGNEYYIPNDQVEAAKKAGYTNG